MQSPDTQRTHGERPRWSVGHERARGPARLEAFSDAVIAIMLTVLSLQLLEIDVAAIGRAGLARALLDHWPAFLAFLLSFLVVGQIWVTHHNMWRYVACVDQGLLVLNLLLLLTITLLPFCARLLAESLKPDAHAYQKLAVVLYAANAFAMAIIFNFSLWWAKRRELFHEEMDPSLYLAIRRRFLLGPAIYLFALATAAFLPWVSIGSYLAVVALYIWPGAGDLPIDALTDDV